MESCISFPSSMFLVLTSRCKCFWKMLFLTFKKNDLVFEQQVGCLTVAQQLSKASSIPISEGDARIQLIRQRDKIPCFQLVTRVILNSDAHTQCLLCLGKGHIEERCSTCQLFKKKTQVNEGLAPWAGHEACFSTWDLCRSSSPSDIFNAGASQCSSARWCCLPQEEEITSKKMVSQNGLHFGPHQSVGRLIFLFQEEWRLALWFFWYTRWSWAVYPLSEAACWLL